MSEKTIFQKIIDREIPATIEHEDEQCIVIHDISPQAPTHLLLIPKKRIVRIGEATPEDTQLLGHLMAQIPLLAQKLGWSDGFRTVINNGPYGGEAVPHLHIHLLAGRQMAWPPG
ncbi:histidine triad nucleotide-binding protein [Pelagicoccus sp. NFK12]|uniref:Histidine triad nucleotide-binding protein n=1 Tax=Pelagicoccus enzymogenes TaxID=2773457 RepID=A0A927F7M5_9BACT|nr:histidine triad nucleotide-binding protein [Pelagicoccus enzymogenes]MBD5778716.1 histidine triad nucleotide-binding protein [Pelagicoccus enzymogenes]MDQ8197537.1 histidine triad nucleotide-binding protein [Pelagicoccus enzymogenes]